MFKNILKIALLAFGVAAVDEDAVSTKHGLIHLTHHTFTPSLMANPNMPFVVFTYADWCGHCTNYKSKF